MIIANTYVDYDFCCKKLHVQYKLSVENVYDFYKRRKFLTKKEKENLRRLFCKNEEEIIKLTDKDSRNGDLLHFILDAPIRLKNAYSEIGKAVYNYVRHFPEIKNSIYQTLESEDKVREAVGDNFNGVSYDELKSEKFDEKLKHHTMESPYSHCVEYIMKCDFIFYDGKGLVAVQEYEIPHYSAMVTVNGLCPNEYMPSDHFPVAAKFQYSLN